jgi:hypothetical protein
MVLLFMKIADEFSLHTIAKMGRFVNTLETAGDSFKEPEARRGSLKHFSWLLNPASSSDVLFFP